MNFGPRLPIYPLAAGMADTGRVLAWHAYKKRRMMIQATPLLRCGWRCGYQKS